MYLILIKSINWNMDVRITRGGIAEFCYAWCGLMPWLFLGFLRSEVPQVWESQNIPLPSLQKFQNSHVGPKEVSTNWVSVIRPLLSFWQLFWQLFLRELARSHPSHGYPFCEPFLVIAETLNNFCYRFAWGACNERQLNFGGLSLSVSTWHEVVLFAASLAQVHGLDPHAWPPRPPFAAWLPGGWQP